MPEHAPRSDEPRRLVLRVLLVAGAILLALGLAGNFLLPMLFERNFIALEQWVHGTYQYQRHFVYLHQLLSPFWGYEFALEGPNDGMSFQLGLLPVVLGAAGIAAALRSRSRDRALGLFFGAATLLVLWTMTSSSKAAWELLPLVALIQFPWRLLALTSLTLAILGGAAAGLLSQRKERTAAASPRSEAVGSPDSEPPSPAHATEVSPPASPLTSRVSRITDHASRFTHHASRPTSPAPYILALLIVFASLPYAVPQYTEVTPRDESVLAVLDFELRYADMRGMTAWSGRIPMPEDGPLVAQYLAGETLTQARILEGEGELRPVRHGGASEELIVSSADGVRLQFYTYWFPGWEARVDGQLAETWPEGTNGLITLDVPAGEHQVVLRMTDNTPPRRLGTIISALSLAAILALLLVGVVRRRSA